MLDRTQLHKPATLSTAKVLRYRMGNKAGELDRLSGCDIEENISSWAPNPLVQLGESQFTDNHISLCLVSLIWAILHRLAEANLE
jgi:hypothetical protein